MKIRPLAGLAVLVTLASPAALTAAMKNAETERIAAAATVLDEIRTTPDRDIPKDLWDRAACVAVIPSLKKAAFIFGGEYGKGLISCRVGSVWGSPSFLLLEKGSWGFQIGGETVDVVLLIMNQHGIDRLLQDKVSLGADLSVAGGPVGRDARASTDAQLKAEVLSYSRSQGLFAGVDISGGVLKADNDDNRDLYGREVKGRELLTMNRTQAPKSARPFMAALDRMSVTSSRTEPRP
ncbi:MAG TPA: lipid-binding SYLF domain-containing protein [Vicinamibacterales bacterium]|jgi:lipid-binding SYLF domain-containing protein|nr:lipid-binding SYLF domain-containing protein [Vicinamibacterales bacterium]